MPSHTAEVQKFIRDLRKDGYTVELRKKSNHYAVTRGNKGPMFMSSTPSDHRWLNATLTQMRRMGMTPPEKYLQPKKKKKEKTMPTVQESATIIKARPVPKPAPVAPVAQPKEKPMTEDNTTTTPDAGRFERWVPPEPKKAAPKRTANVYITKMKGLYISAQAMEILGIPEKVEVSVNRASAEMMIWADDHGALSIATKSGAMGKTKAGVIGATALVNHFDLPTQTRWNVIDSAPGRILVKWVDEDHD